MRQNLIVLQIIALHDNSVYRTNFRTEYKYDKHLDGDTEHFNLSLAVQLLNFIYLTRSTSNYRFKLC